MTTSLIPFGVLGGMGPASTNLFLAEIISLYSIKRHARNNYEFPQITMVTIPESNHMTTMVDDKLFESLSNAFEVFLFAKANFVVAPCNTIHHYLLSSQFNPSLPILSIISSVEVLYGKKINGTRMLFLSTTLTKESNIYLEFSKKYNITFVYLNSPDQKKLDEIIMEINGGEVSDSSYYNVLNYIVTSYAVEYIFLACTELSLLKYQPSNLQIIDSLTALSEATFLVSSGEDQIIKYLY